MSGGTEIGLPVPLFTPLKLVAAILLDDVLGAYPFLLLPDEWFYFLMNQAYFLMNVSASPRSVSATGRLAATRRALPPCRVLHFTVAVSQFHFWKKQVFVRANFQPAE